ncbi:MAG: hypothetical protein WA659_01695 [Candidatus Aquirickettsiella sp.]
MKIIISRSIFFILMMSVWISNQSVAVEMYREPSQKLLSGKHFSVVIDRGKLQKAIRDSSNNYLFSEVGPGVKPLVLIGTMQEIVTFLYEKRKIEIHNKISSLPCIYMSATYYQPKARFEGIFPVHAAINQFTKSLLDFVPVPGNVETVSEILSSGKTLQEILSVLVRSKKPYPESKLIYLKISYLKDIGAVEVGKKVLPLASILYKFLGVKETSA